MLQKSWDWCCVAHSSSFYDVLTRWQPKHSLIHLVCTTAVCFNKLTLNSLTIFYCSMNYVMRWLLAHLCAWFIVRLHDSLCAWFINLFFHSFILWFFHWFILWLMNFLFWWLLDWFTERSACYSGNTGRYLYSGSRQGYIIFMVSSCICPCLSNVASLHSKSLFEVMV